MSLEGVSDDLSCYAVILCGWGGVGVGGQTMGKLEMEHEMEDPTNVYLHPNAAEIFFSHLKEACVSGLQFI